MYKESDTSKRIKWFGIPIIGILLTFVMNEDYDLFTFRHLISCFISVSTTAIYWLSCTKVVIFLWNKYPWHINPLKHLWIEFSLIMLVIAILTGLNILIASFFLSINWNNFDYQFTVILILTFFLTSMHEGIFFYEQWKEHIKKSEFLEKAQFESQYELLKSQVNPHFLFNSLNTLHSHLDKNEKAQEYIENLADFLRYSFNHKKEELMSLEKELEIVKQYITIQKMRFNEGLNYSIDIDESYLHYRIPTFSLQMLVENCIKHNIVSKAKPLNITIKLHEKNLVVSNNLQRRSDVQSNHQGLSNIKERYRFLSPHNILIEENDSTFSVSLPILKIET